MDVQASLQRAMDARPGGRIALDVKIDRAALAHYANALDRTLSVPAQDATASLASNLTPVLHPAKAGLQIKVAATQARIESALSLAVRPLLRPAGKTTPAAVTRNHFGPVVVIHRGSNTMNVFNGTRSWRTFKVATGQSQYPTPLGRWTIVVKWRNPWWYPPKSPWAAGAKPIPPGPGNPLGTRWMGLDAPGVGMHGTPDAASIGYSASHGCIRMYVPDAEWLFDQVHLGTPVFIVSR